MADPHLQGAGGRVLQQRSGPHVQLLGQACVSAAAGHLQFSGFLGQKQLHTIF